MFEPCNCHKPLLEESFQKTSPHSLLLPPLSRSWTVPLKHNSVFLSPYFEVASHSLNVYEGPGWEQKLVSQGCLWLPRWPLLRWRIRGGEELFHPTTQGLWLLWLTPAHWTPKVLESSAELGMQYLHGVCSAFRQCWFFFFFLFLFLFLFITNSAVFMLWS